MDVTNDDEPPSSPNETLGSFFFWGGGIGGRIPWISIQLRCHLHEERDALKPLGTQIFFDLKLTPRKVVTRYFFWTPGI